MTAPLRVLYLAPPSEHVGPLSRYSFLDEEIRTLAEAGVDAYVISRARNAERDDGRIHVRALPPDSFQERARTLAFMARWFTHTPLANYSDFRQLYRTMRVERFAADVIRQENISLIHSFFGWPRGFGGLAASAAMSVPLIAGIRGSDINMIPSLGYGSRLDPSFDRAVRILMRNADRMIFHSEFLRRRAIPLGAREDKCRVIMKGVRLDRFTATRSGSTTLPVNRQQPIILAVAGLVPIKGLDHVLEALSRVKAAGQTFSFVVCGDGEQGPLRQKAAELSLSDVVDFRGKVPRTVIADYFASAAMLVHGALIEAAGNVLLEAMASGVPVVCTDAGGPAEYVQHGKTGYVVPIADPDAMATRIIELLQHPERLAQFGRAARELAERAFSYDRMIDETLDVYREVLSSAAPG
jgi:glycosyltransferase involved in cell wall biosynthesis